MNETLKEKITYTIFEEIDMYINLVQEEVFMDDPNRKGIEDFIIKTVVPRMNMLREIVHNYNEDGSIKNPWEMIPHKIKKED